MGNRERVHAAGACGGDSEVLVGARLTGEARTTAGRVDAD